MRFKNAAFIPVEWEHGNKIEENGDTKCGSVLSIFM
jgi:hypothetical protein